MKKLVSAKLHGIHVTDCNINYHGSITLDPDHCEQVCIIPLEFVDIWNKNSGSRISTYVIFGERGSKCCILNGAAARTCQVGDQLIICSSDYIDKKDIVQHTPKILTFTSDNNIDEKLSYSVTKKLDGFFDFSIEKNIL